MNLVERQEQRRVRANANARAKRRANPRTGRPGRKPKLNAAQQLDALRWANRRDRLRIELRALGTMPSKARELGIAESTLKRYIYEQQKQPVRTAP